jgi:hypothetical protein
VEYQVQLTAEEVKELKIVAKGRRLNCINLRDGFQPQTKSYQQFQRSAEFWDGIVAKLLRCTED